jgi:hypothetical protein
MTFDADGVAGPNWHAVTQLCQRVSQRYRHVVVREANHRTYAQWLDWDRCDNRSAIYRAPTCLGYATRYPHLILAPRVLMVALVRDPVSRFVSAFHMAMANAGGDAHCGFLHCTRDWSRRMSTGNASIDDLAGAYGTFRGVHNLQTRYLGRDWVYDHPTPEWNAGRGAGPWRNIYDDAAPQQWHTIFKRAQARLARLDICGTMEQADSFLYSIMRRLGVQRDFVQCRTSHVLTAATRRQHLSPHMHDSILAYDAWDAKLYAVAQRVCGAAPNVTSVAVGEKACTRDGSVCAQRYEITERP